MKKNMQMIIVAFAMVPLMAMSVMAQMTISGKVTDENQEELPGVNVMLQGTNVGTITDINGEYQLEVNDDEGVLIISYVGYTSETVNINGRSNIDISLSPDIQELSEIVVVGYGTQKKSDVTGSIVSINQEDIESTRSANAVEAIQGKAAGVDMTRTSGRAGSGYDITIRGTRSLTASNDPLYIVDGIQYGSQIDINPNDIKSIEILKDASSTAIYGSRGANGVIIITTKQGKKGQMNISLNTYYGVTMPNGEIPLARKDYYLQFKNDLNWMREWRLNPNALPNSTGYLSELRQTEIQGLNNGYDFDWYDELLRNGRQQDYNLSITGGGEKTTYNASINYFQEDGMVDADKFQRFNLRFNLESKAKEFLTIGTSTIISFTKNEIRPIPLGDARKLSPLVEPYDENGEIIPYPKFPDEVVNPVITADPDFTFSENRNINAFGTFYINFDITDYLSFKSSFNMDLDLSREGDFSGVYPGVNGTSTAEVLIGIGTDYTIQNFLNFSKKIKDHNFNIMAGSEIIYRRDENYRNYGQDLELKNSQWYALGSAGSNVQIGTVGEYPLRETKLVSFLSRAHYSLKERYIFQFTARYDGASQLAPGYKWDFFPSASFAWRINEEPFFQGVVPVSNLKLRLGYGVTGNQAVDAFSHFGKISRNPLYYEFGTENQAVNGYRTVTNTNPLLGWEKTTAYNLGLDFGILDNRIQGTVEFYKTETEDLLLEQKLSPHSGITEIVANVGSTRNQGVEITLSTKNINTNKFTWSTDVTFYTNNEEITALASGVQQDLLNGWFVGYPVDVHHNREKIGIWQLGEEEEAAQYGLLPGDIKFNDVNGDTTYNETDRIILGTPRPDWTAGLTNRFTYGNFDFSFFIFARWGQMIQDDVKREYSPNGLENTMELDYWTPFNPTNDTPRPDATRTRSGYSELVSNTYTDGSFIKFRDITLGYSLPNSVLDNTVISKLRVYVTAKNPIIISEYFSKGRWDPELGGGVDLPMPKMYAAGLNITF